ncbi:Protein-L-isoaspartate O-methyltransferase [Sphingobium herbicidovorans NBRC 16415]|uniref:Protein-L-isoaspartate O-methyltransferase n=1 Tax=Sphingobium herbicidovorans (strain ATCC 700291 / DSM 11019 / CCUG 56400 / KCTC 2939 / LMG 18315 / NBRC 16415 / MH) TaxID=1219045 RepID=A0A086PBV7_SPHHM|nr:protein-L-isoaspartate(D-aspartate) O-methyltransferase [Sphingobium herbicidovorans]KFG90875.1 Protein-L-isoaspartate O-methyltransferase [Sphingobium herbicidovorans NBRC 16415]
MPDFVKQREHMVKVHLAQRGIRDPHVLKAMRKVPRERFVSEGLEEFTYEDSALPIEEEQTISQPYIVAAMIEAAEVQPGDHVLEVGAGSGYAAAVMGQIAQSVVAIERHPALGKLAAARIAALGYDNVEIRIGDGSAGAPDDAPFDAILVAAAGPDVPPTLKQQLKVGGHLVIPVGELGDQKLCKVSRTAQDRFEEANLGAVRFVPLIGGEGWREDGSRAASNHVPGASRRLSVPEMIAKAAEPLPEFDDPAFGKLFDRFADRRVIMLGEASHGTTEFYQARAAITRHLIEQHGFTIVALEADWPDAARVDRYVRHRPRREDDEPPFQRFPTWMWRNTDIQALTGWMHEHNKAKPLEARAGFYGLDIYNMSGSIGAVLDYLDRIDPHAAAVARERYGCLTPWQRNPATYGRAALSRGYAQCEKAVIEQCRDLLERRLDYVAHSGDDFLDAAQNARLIASAERYYRIMYYGGAESWNLRDTHMFETLRQLLEAKGSGAKAIVWAHNSHIGDARHTDMGQSRDELNIGQLAREQWGDDVALIGFGTHTGTVAAATDWDGDMEVKRVNPSRPDSLERQCHDSGVSRFLLDLSVNCDAALLGRLSEPMLERFIGVIYRPETELWSHYSQAVFARQFDAFVWFDETSAVTPLGPEDHEGMPETYPFGE